MTWPLQATVEFYFVCLKNRQSSEKWRVLFLPRIIREKGIYETIETIFLLKDKYPMIKLIIAGEEEELKNVKYMVHDCKISNVKFAGYISDEEKRPVFEKAQIFLFPTYYCEGLPAAVVEAISFGLPVVTRPVRGLADFFKNEEYDFITKSKEPAVFANCIEKLIFDKGLCESISFYNFSFGKKWFLASKAIKRLEKICNEVLSLD